MPPTSNDLLAARSATACTFSVTVVGPLLDVTGSGGVPLVAIEAPKETAPVRLLPSWPVIAISAKLLPLLTEEPL